MAYDLVLVGSGFASVFFLKTALETGAVRSAVIVERGASHDWEWQVSNRTNSPEEYSQDKFSIMAGPVGKDWPHTIAVGGGSNCWWANAMRFHPSDFDLKTRYGIGADWPIGYEDLEPYYCDAEDVMQLSGDPESAALFPRSRAYPQPPHRYSGATRILKKAYPDSFFSMPQARARVATTHRNACCSNSRCNLCPARAKFMIINDMPEVLSDPRVTLLSEHDVQEVLVEGGRVTGVAGKTTAGEDFEILGETVGLGANAIYNPFLLLKSGITDGPVGRGLNEQYAVTVRLLLNGIDEGDGSSHTTGAGFSEIHGEFRREASGGFFETNNLPFLRPHPTRYRQMLDMSFLVDDLRQDRNYVGISPDDPSKPVAHFEGFSDYAFKGVDRIRERASDIFSVLPIEDMMMYERPQSNRRHIQGTTVMGQDPAHSVVDGALVHHRLRNLLVLGSGAFPTAGWANPTLTICATAMRAADLYYGA